MPFKYIVACTIFFLLSGCENLAVQFTSPKKPVSSHGRLAKMAEQKFWHTLHHGDYFNIPEANNLLMAAYVENPNDPHLAAHIGFLHIWQITERNRMQNIPPEMVDNIILSTKYFSDAVQLDPADARYLGFLGDSKLMEGKIFNDEREQVHGYFTLKRAMGMWPEFNNFTAGYVMSSLPAHSDHFKEGLKWQWETLDACAMQRVSHQHPDFSPFMKYETQTGPKRACWNSWIAPYNFEGFFLNMGDMLVKSGDWQTGIKIYRNARLASNYYSWPYREFLERRIAHARENVRHFQQEPLGCKIKKDGRVYQSYQQHPDKMIMFNSGYGCMACHQQ
jgi:hypothetical protein